jgi:hypothetical protein
LLKITVMQHRSETVLVLEGRLERPWVPELEKVFSQQNGAAYHLLTVDLCGLTGMDEAGEASLHSLHHRGARLRCADVMNRYLVERMALGAVKPLQAPCRPSQCNETQENNKQTEEIESANCNQF